MRADGGWQIVRGVLATAAGAVDNGALANIIGIDMEIRHLRYFLAVCECHSFSRAAERLHVTQPTLSHQVRQLEQEIGTPLLDRLGKRVEVTSAGDVFRGYCERALKEVESGVNAIAELEGLTRGTLSIAVFHSFTNSLLPPVLAEFASRYPNVHVIVRQVSRDEMERALLSGSLDLAIGYAEFQTAQLVAEKLFDESLVLVVGSRHSLASTRKIPMKQLAEIPLVMLTPEFGARQELDQFFASEPAKPQIVLEMNAIEPILSTIRNSRLATVLSAGAVGTTKQVHVVRLTNPVPRRAAAILWRQTGHRSAAAQRMAEMIRTAYSVR